MTTPPDAWAAVTVRDLLSADRGISVGVMYPGSNDPTGVPLIRAGDLVDNKINPRPEFRITQSKHHEYRRTSLEGGEVLLSLVGVVGQCAIVPLSMAGWNVARAIAVLRLSDPGEAPFVRACLLSPPLRHLMQAWSTTTVQATLNLKEIRQLPIPRPPVSERCAIGEIVEVLDEKIDLNHRMNRTLDATAAAVYSAWFVAFGAAHRWTEHDSPSEWGTGSFGETIQLLGGGTPKTSEPSYWGGSIPWFSAVDAPSDGDVFVSNTNKKITQAGLDNSSTRILPVGTTIITARGTVGKLAVVGTPMTMNQSCYGVRGAGGRGDYFTYYALRGVASELKRRSHGSVFDTITTDTFKTLETKLVPVEHTQRFDDAVRPLMERILANLQETKTLATIRDILLPKLLSGEVRMSEAEAVVADAV